MQCWDRLIRMNPQNWEAFANRAVTLQKLRRPDEALMSYEHAIRLNPDDAQTYANRGVYLGTELARYAEAAADFEDVLRLAPHYDYARGHRLHMRMRCCDWRDCESEIQAIESGVRERKRVC